MAEEQDAENIFDVDTTISIVREEKPVKLIKQLDQKYEVIKKAEGIYREGGRTVGSGRVATIVE